MRPLVDGLVGAVRVNGQAVLCDLGQSGTVPGLRPQTCAQYANSTAGRAVLLQSMAAGDGCVQFAWSSALDLSAAGGVSGALTYIPVGRDAVTYAVTDNSDLPRTLTVADLKAIYTCDAGYVGAGPAYTVHPLLPQAGSSVRTAFEAAVGITDADVVGGRYPCVSDTVGGGLQAVAENDGRVLSQSAVVPYAVSAYLAQIGQAVADHRGRAVLGSYDGSTPVGHDGGAGDVTFAVSSRSSVPRELTMADLRAIYTCDSNYVGTPGAVGIEPFLPAAGGAGSVRAEWESLVGISDVDVVAGKYWCLHDSLNGNPVGENDGRGLPGDGVVPMSGAAYAAQLSGGAIDHRGLAVPGVIDGRVQLVNTDTGSAAAGRWLVVPTGALGASPGRDLFVGSGSGVCLETEVIQRFGYGVGMGVGVDAGCGDVSRRTL
ncbi:hypothetical protein GCM10009839_44430 [Catenulispora yoronensis]|uniref:Uncharacterized protein n=2 Tax=Catenulispora yoronensis TaxID=450799 RepID=A0ABN2UI14_9ACTN